MGKSVEKQPTDHNKNKLENPVRIKTIFCAVAAALYGAAAAQAATGLLPDQATTNPHQLKAVSVPDPKQKKRQSVQAGQNKLLVNDGLNVQIQPKAKFVPEADLQGEQVYIVRLASPSVSVYSQQLTQQAKVRTQQKLYVQGQATEPAVVSYQKRLLNEQQNLLQVIQKQVGNKEFRQQYTKALNGFSLKLTQEEAEKISRLSQVVSVQRSKLYQLHTDTGPLRIAADKVWTGATSQNTPFKGEGTIVGIIDTGVNTDHPSFADIGGDGYNHTNPWGAGNYAGDCSKEEFADKCNDKLIGVHSYKVITDTYQGIYPAVGEDVSGHGSHTASTAAGNVLNNVDYVVPAISDVSDGIVVKAGLFTQLSGVAPHANIISYQVCLPLDGCPGEALVAAIEDAVTDGVDAINFSIGNVSNVTSPWQDSVELAFLGAHQAGIAVAASAGNAGGDGDIEYGSYIDHASPWLLNVAASTTGRRVEIDTTAGDFTGGTDMPAEALAGGGVNQQAVTGVVVKAADFGDELCESPFAAGTFDNLTNSNGDPYLDDQGQAANIIVVCSRGGNGRVEKSANVAAGGAEGFILYNTTDFGDEGTVIYTDSYAVPGIHLSNAQWYQLTPWLDSVSPTGHQLTLSATVVERVVDDSQADELAGFSSRGPSLANPEHLVPAVSAPGVDIYAATNDESPFAASKGETPVTADFGMYSGTSMAAPHVAGSLALLSQARPDWTVAEKQSALQLTADPEVMHVQYKGETWETSHKAEIYRAGTGRINVAAAIDTGLVMNESYENMLAADPDNGGQGHKLNLPELVNFHCKPVCNWIRTFTATKDGSWTLTADEVTNWSGNYTERFVQQGVKLEMIPAKFSLKAGETQSVLVRASITNTQDIFSNSEVELHSHLMITEDNGKSPAMRMPMVFKYDNGDLPDRLELTAHRNNSSYQINDMPMPEAAAPVARVYATTKATVKTVTLPKDDDFVFPWNYPDDSPVTDVMDEAIHSFWIEVPENSKRLIVENLAHKGSSSALAQNYGNTVVYVGKDFDADGVIEPETELLCMSSHIVLNNFCNINEPDAGQYWAMLYNPNEYKEAGTDTFEYAYGVVSGELATDLTLDALAATNGVEPVDLTFRWNKPDMVRGDIYYTGFDLGSSAANAGNLGFVPLKMQRGEDDVSLSSSKTKVLVGQSVDFTFATLPNLSGADRDFSITATLPAGLRINAEDIQVSDDATVTEVSLADGVLTLKGNQKNTLGVSPSYQISDSDTDAMCRIPDFGQNNDKYVDLSEFGFSPSFGDTPDMLRDGTEVAYSLMFADGEGFGLYNNAFAKSPAMYIRGNGNISFEPMPYFWPAHFQFPYDSFPYQALGVLWRGWGGVPFEMTAMATPYDVWNGEGITMASTQSGWAIVEWDGSRSMPYLGEDPVTSEPLYGDNGDRFDYEVIFNTKTRFGKGEHEIYMAYDSLEFNGSNRGSVGLQGYKGQTYAFGPLEGYLGVQYALNDLDSKLSEGLVLCYDYVGPESSQFSVTVPAVVKASATASELVVSATSSIAGMEDIQMSLSVEVPGNITLGAIGSQTVAEEGELTGIQVLYSDDLNTSNTISVSGDHISATVDGHETGDTFSIKPAANFSGTTLVTVTVADVENPADKASTSFELVVTPVNDAPDAKVVNASATGAAGSTIVLDASGSSDIDGDALTYSWKQTAGATVSSVADGAKLTLSQVPAGNFSFEVVVSDGQLTDSAIVTLSVTDKDVSTDVSKKSSGSFGAWLLALMAALVLVRRQQQGIKA